MASILLSNGLRYQPRPVIQSYTAYTASLAELNAAHLRGPRAPDWIVFDITPIDVRYPSLDDNLSWPELLARYAPQPIDKPLVGGGCLLKKRDRPGSFELVPITTLDTRIDQWTAVPSAEEGPVWAKIHVGTTIAGKLADAALRRPRIYLTIGWPNGIQERFLGIPALMDAGFLLSPVISCGADFYWMSDTSAQGPRWRQGVPDRTVKNFRIETSGRWAYGDKIKVEFYRLRISPADGAGGH
jgi:hypothetical protein